jgi:hypothetical protein
MPSDRLTDERLYEMQQQPALPSAKTSEVRSMAHELLALRKEVERLKENWLIEQKARLEQDNVEIENMHLRKEVERLKAGILSAIQP